MPVDFASLTPDAWYAWTLEPLGPAWAALGPAFPAMIDGAVLRALVDGVPLVAAYGGGGDGWDAQLVDVRGTALSVPGAVFKAAEPLSSVRAETTSGERLEVTALQVGGEPRLLIRAGTAVLGLLTPEAAAPIADALA